MVKDKLVVSRKEEVEYEVTQLIELVIESLEGRSLLDVDSLVKESHSDRGLESITVFFKPKHKSASIMQ